MSQNDNLTPDPEDPRDKEKLDAQREEAADETAEGGPALPPPRFDVDVTTRGLVEHLLQIHERHDMPGGGLPIARPPATP